MQVSPVAPLSMVQPAKVPIRGNITPQPGPRVPPAHPLDAHQMHMQHLANTHQTPQLDAHQLHMQHLNSIGQGPDAINKYLTNDTTYQQQMAAIQRALGDYQANSLQQQNSYNVGYGQNRTDLDEQQRLSGINQGEDFGSRGMLRSGLYAVDNTDRLNNFANQYAHLDQARSDYMLNSGQGLQNYVTSQQLAQQQARQDAINRRAISLIGSSPTAVR